MFKKYGQSKEIARAMFLYIGYSILGPLLIVGGIGYFIDRVLQTRFFLLFSVFIAYIISNILMFRKLKSLNKEIEKINVDKKSENSNSQVLNNNYDDDDDDDWPIIKSNKNDQKDENLNNESGQN